jgi:7-keto-8-aminopelargonate synthetase-like enzyme
LSLVQEDPRPRERLKKLSARLREGLRALSYNALGSESQIVPVLLGEATAALACADHLFRHGIFAPAIRPPTVHAGECRIRFSVTADHEPADIDLVLTAMEEWKK